MRLDKPVGTLLLLWPTLAALWMAAEGVPPIYLILVFALGTILMRSAGCVINDYADRNVDGQVTRTKKRPLATGKISPRNALYLFFVLVLLSAILLVFLNRPTQWLAPIGVALAAVYPFMKRWTHMPQVVLGAAFSWGIVMAWTSVTGELSSVAGLLFFGSLVWIVAYDTLYAMADREDDIAAGVKSTAILFGPLDRVMVGILQAIALVAFILVGRRLGYINVYYVATLIIAALFVYQQYLIRKRAPEACLTAFKNNTWVGFAMFLGTIAETILSTDNG